MRQVCSGAANRWHPSSRLTSLRPRTVNVASQFANREQDGCGVSWTCHPRPTKRIECCIEQHSRSGTSRTRTADHMAVLLTSVHGNSVPSAELVVGNRVCGWNNDLPTKMRGLGRAGGFRLASVSRIHRVAQGGVRWARMNMDSFDLRNRKLGPACDTYHGGGLGLPFFHLFLEILPLQDERRATAGQAYRSR